MAKTPANAEKLMNGLVPAATAKARGEAAAIQKQIDAANGGFALTAADWDFYAEKVRRGRVRPRRVAGPAVLRPRPGAQGRRLLRGQCHVRHHLQGAQGHPGLPPRRPRVGGLRRRRQARSPSTTATISPRPSKRGGAWCDSFVDQSRLLGWKPAIDEQHQLHQAGPGRAGAHLVDRRRHSLPRVRARAPRHVPERRVPHASATRRGISSSSRRSSTSTGPGSLRCSPTTRSTGRRASRCRRRSPRRSRRPGPSTRAT